MDKYTVKLMPRAVEDLDRIYGYIAETLQVPETAAKLMSQLEDGILSLSTMPERCALRKVGIYAYAGYRQLLIENYMVVFRIDEIQKMVIVVTVQYQKKRF